MGGSCFRGQKMNDRKNAATVGEIREYIGLLVAGYVSSNTFSWIPVSVIGVIVEFHGIYDVFFESNILDNNAVPCDRILLLELVSNQLNRVVKLERIYSGINDGFFADAFHKNCDEKGPTLVLIWNEFNAVFGGYTGANWSTPETWTTKYDKTAFLYQVYPEQNVYEQRRSDGYDAIFMTPDYMCAFSGQCDLIIKDEPDKNRDSYAWAKHYKFNAAKELIGSQQDGKQVYFKINEIEVYKVL